MHHVTVLMPDGKPAFSVQVKKRSKGTSSLHGVYARGYCIDTFNAVYLIMHDGLLGELSEGIRRDLQFGE